MSNQKNPNLEETMRLFYIGMHKIDPNECVLIEDHPNTLQINYQGKNQSLEDFLKSRARLVTIDHTSTKEANEKAIAKAKIPVYLSEVFSTRFMEMFHWWGIIEDNKKSIGVADRLYVYNGFPNLVNSEDLAKDPDKYHNIIADAFKKCDNPLNILTMIVPVQIYDRARIKLHKDFLAENPVTLKS